jgi:asparagine synthase (glutamine-hydrolysing)
LWERPKAGFSIPLAQWLRKELRPWTEQLLEGEQFSHSNYFNVAVIRKLWRQHRDGKTDAHNQLWNILMFEAWRQAQ